MGPLQEQQVFLTLALSFRQHQAGCFQSWGPIFSTPRSQYRQGHPPCRQGLDSVFPILGILDKDKGLLSLHLRRIHAYSLSSLWFSINVQ